MDTEAADTAVVAVDGSSAAGVDTAAVATAVAAAGGNSVVEVADSVVEVADSEEDGNSAEVAGTVVVVDTAVAVEVRCCWFYYCYQLIENIEE